MMPGVLIMNDENANGIQPDNQLPKQSALMKPTETPVPAVQQQQASSSASSEPLQAAITLSAASLPPSVDQPSVNGDHAVQQLDGTADAHNDVHARVATDEEQVSQVGKVPIPESTLVRPPDIEHITTGFQPMSKLIDRVTQECFNELVDLINQLADETDQASAGMVNGTSGFAVVPNASGPSVNDVSRRVRMMEFANKHRERFIKLLVLLQWSRQVEDVSTMIDLWNWYRTQVGYHDEAAEWVGRLRISTSRAKQPNPDIQTALEVLSKGKASWISDLGYIPPKPLPPKKLLRILRNINSLLSVRLILHEDVPYLMRHWTVASGRVTFTVPEEFELDLSLANEDPSSQLYFIDLRLLFSPTSDLPETYFRGYLESEINKVLATTRLSGCYNFLHNFVLTHKISILHRQAQAMAAGTWTKAIKVETVHRSLIVQYWLDSVHTKNWIEIGIVSGNLNGKKTWNPAQTPRISIRWIRGGVEVHDMEHCLDLKDLSMENVLNTFIALHKSHILRGVHDKLQQHSDPSGRALRMDLRTSDSDSADCRLKMKLGVFGNECSVIVDTFTGRLSFIPLLHVLPRLDQEMNSLKDPASDAHRSVGNIICNDLHAAVERKAINYGWQAVRNAEAKVEKGASIFGYGYSRQSFFRGQGWCEKWAIAVTTGLRGVSWWVAEISDDSSPIRTVRTAVSIQPSCNSLGKNPMNLKFFRKLEKIAVAVVSLYTTSRQLKRLGVPHTIRRFNFRQMIADASTAQAGPRQHQYAFPVMYIKLSALMKQRKRRVSLISDFLRLTPQNYIIHKDGKMTHVVMGIMTHPKRIRNILTQMRDRDVVFQESGGFAIFLRASFGAPFVDQLVDRLERIERLSDVVRTLDVWDLDCRLVSLGRIIVKYYGGFYAELDFQQTRTDRDSNVDDKAAPLSIRVKFEGKNPHRRVQAFLGSLLTDRETGVDDFACALAKTFPLLRAFNTIENKTLHGDYQEPPEKFSLTTSATNRTAFDVENTVNSSSYLSSTFSPYPPPHSLSFPSIHARNFDWFRLSYTNPRCTFDIRLRQAMEKVFWHVEETSKKEWYANATSNNNTTNVSSAANPAMNKPAAAATIASTTNTTTSISNPNTTRSTAKGLNVSSNPSTGPTSSTAVPSKNLFHRPASLTPALKELFAQRGVDWMGMRRCVIAGVKGIEPFVEKLDKVVRGCAILNESNGDDDRAGVEASTGTGAESNNNNSNDKGGKSGAAEVKAEIKREIVVIE